ncbi:MAG: ABC transporter ATP-binding protein/permease [Bacteroidota bacterium]|nr:ABC transporter ATP-binding protein/permease [Bacteroidota bacterium]
MSKLRDRQFHTEGSIFPFLKRLFSYSMKYRKWIKGFIFFVLMVAAVEAAIPIVWLNLLDNAVVPMVEQYKPAFEKGLTPEIDFAPLTNYALMILGLGVILSASVFMFINFAGKIQEYVIYDIRQDLFKKLQELSFSFYDKSAVGWLMSRITSDSIKVTELISWGMIELIWGTGMIVFCLIAMFIYNWKLAIIVTLTIPALSLISIKVRRLILKYSRESRRYNSEITASFNEHISGVEVNKSTVQETRASSEFESLSEKMRLSSYKSAYFTAMYTPLVIFGGSIAAAMIIYFGGRMAITLPPEITVGLLAAFFGYATLIYEPILDISKFYSQAQSSISAGERIFSLLDTQSTIKDRQDADDFDNIEGDIEFENVSFHYEKDKPVLDNVNLKIEACQSIALVGETGGGKSTIINLICRFYEPTKGKIKIDGIDYMDKTIQSLGRKLGVVLQTPHLFSGSIRENIRYGRDEASEEELVNALLLIGGDEFIERLDEEAGEGGDKLSLGEKQLISFARAVLANPRIFIMDEATSSVDTLTEAKIQSGIHEMIKGRTSIIIAHRLSTIKNCDRILVIKKGKIIEDGNHHDLMVRKGQYYSLYTRQLRQQREQEMFSVS